LKTVSILDKQQPKLWNYADNVDTRFVNNIVEICLITEIINAFKVLFRNLRFNFFGHKLHHETQPQRRTMHFTARSFENQHKQY
jgi:hypothetical protein